jgi:hypothetical protein
MSPAAVPDYVARAMLAGLWHPMPPKTDSAAWERLVFPYDLAKH